jgi:hypothetical protein
MGRVREFADDASALLVGFMLLKWLGSWKNLLPEPYEEWSKADKGGRGAGRGSTTAPVPQGATNVWSEDTMRLFAREMALTGMDPQVVLLGVAAASNFNADEALGGYVGLLLVAREDLTSLGYPGVPTFEELDAPHQIPWLARVLSYRIASSGGVPPADVPELALLLHPASNPNIAEAIRNEAARRAHDAEGTSIYIHHANLLRHVLAQR